eukprot:c8928_g1_i1 orf=166-447(-)
MTLSLAQGLQWSGQLVMVAGSQNQLSSHRPAVSVVATHSHGHYIDDLQGRRAGTTKRINQVSILGNCSIQRMFGILSSPFAGEENQPATEEQL